MVSIGFNMILYDINDITWTSWSTQASKLPLVPSCGTMSRWSLSDTCHKNLMLTLTYGSFPSNFPLIFPTPRTTPTPLFLHIRGTLQISSSHFWEVLSDIITVTLPMTNWLIPPEDSENRRLDMPAFGSIQCRFWTVIHSPNFGWHQQTHKLSQAVSRCCGRLSVWQSR